MVLDYYMASSSFLLITEYIVRSISLADLTCSLNNMDRTDDWELWESDGDDDNAGKEQECTENAAQFELDLVREGQSGGKSYAIYS